MAGYQSAAAADLDARHRGDTSPEPGRLFVAANRLAQILALLNSRRGGGPTNPDVVARLLQRHPDALHRDVTETRCAWLAFAVLGTATLPASTRLSVRTEPRRPTCPCSVAADADFLLGATVLEVKSGRLDQRAYLDHLIKQMIIYALLAHHDGYTINHVAVYAVRYQRLLRYLVPPLLNGLAGGQVYLATTAAELAEVIRRDNPRGDCWQLVG